MSLHIVNRRASGIYVATSLYYPRDCPDDLFNKVGWFRVEGGQWATVSSDDMKNRYIYFYAQADDGAEWSGNCPISVRNAAFGGCASQIFLDGWTARFKQVDIGNATSFRLELID